jgi:hypothetical protein
MKFSGIIGLIFLVMFILTNLKPVSAGTDICTIHPLNDVDKANYCPTCGTTKVRCAIKVDKNLDGDTTDEGEGPGVAGCDCAENYCTDWCTNNICDWAVRIKICAAVCNIPSLMPHCVGAVICPSADAPCDGNICGYSGGAGACCVKDTDCVTYTLGGPAKCTIPEGGCYGYYNFETNQPVLTTGFKCDYADAGQPCRNDTDCRPNTGLVCRNNICSVSSPCSGPIILNFLPNPAWAGNYQVNANVSGLSNCNGKKVLIRVEQPGMNPGWTSCTCTVSGTGCYCNVVAPYASSSGQSYNFKAYVDVNNNGFMNADDLTTTASLTVSCKNPGASCSYSTNTCCWPGGVSYVCSSGKCQQSFGGGCPTLFVYDGKGYVEERKSNLHSQRGIDTIDDIILATKPTVIDGMYLLSLKETTLPEHSYIDSVKLYAVNSDEKKELKLISAEHSRLGDVTSTLIKSDDTRTDTKVFDSIELKFIAEEGDYFIFEIEGYNPDITGQMFYKVGVTNLSIIAVVAAVVILAVVFFAFKYFAAKKSK